MRARAHARIIQFEFKSQFLASPSLPLTLPTAGPTHARHTHDTSMAPATVGLTTP